MEVKFVRDIYNAGTKVFEAGKQYEGDLARYVRRGDAVEVKGKGAETTDQAAETAAKPKGGKGKAKK